MTTERQPPPAGTGGGAGRSPGRADHSKNSGAGIRRAPWANESIAPTMSMLGRYDVACIPVPALVAAVKVLAERIDPNAELDPALVVPVTAIFAAVHRASAPEQLEAAVGHVEAVSPRLADFALARAGIAHELIGWGYPLEGQILRAKAPGVPADKAEMLVAADEVQVLLDPSEPKLWFITHIDGERHAVTLRMFRPASGGGR